MSAKKKFKDTQKQGKKGSLFTGNPMANRNSSVLARVLKMKIRREGGLKDGLDDGARPDEAFAVGDAKLDHGRKKGATNALTFHTFGKDEEE